MSHKDPDARREWAKRHREEHRDEIRARKKVYREANRDRENERTAQWRARNPDKIAGYQEAARREYASDPETRAKRREYARRYRDEHREWYRDYARRRSLLRKYGLTLEGLHAMLAAQDGRCAICRRVVDYMLLVDHDHDTGVVRGLLCRECNLGLGHFGDSISSLLAAAEYLRDGAL